MTASLEDPRGKMVDTPECSMPNSEADRANISATRYSRLRRVEAGIFTWKHYEELTEQAQEEAHIYEKDVQFAEFLRQINTEITDEDKQKHKEALSRAQEMKAKQGTETATLGRSFIRDADKA